MARVKSLEKDEKHCPLHEDYEKIRMNLVKLFSNITIHDLVKRANNAELITI